MQLCDYLHGTMRPVKRSPSRERPSEGEGEGGLAPHSSVLATIRAHHATSSDSERRVAEVILRRPEQVTAGTAAQLAGMADVAPSSVIRACERLGYAGYTALRLALVRELGADAAGAVRQGAPAGSVPAALDGSDPSGVLVATFADAARSIIASATTIETRAFAAAIAAITEAHAILLIGESMSAPLAADTAYRLRLLGLAATYHHDSMVENIAARQMTTADVVVAISHTGSMTQTLAVFESAATAGARTVAVTSAARSPLGDVADVTLVAACGHIATMPIAMTSHLIHVALLDALVAAIALRIGDRAVRALDQSNARMARHRRG